MPQIQTRMIAELKEENATLTRDLEQAECERDELESQLNRVAGDEMDAADLAEEIERFRSTARAYMQQCQAMQRELLALRKRKGIEVALPANWHDVWGLVQNVAAYEGRHQAQARKLVEAILTGK